MTSAGGGTICQKSEVAGVQLFSLITHCNVVELYLSYRLLSGLSDKKQDTPSLRIQGKAVIHLSKLNCVENRQELWLLVYNM